MALLAAFGTLLKVGNGASPEVFTTVAQVGNIAGPGMKADTIDVSNHNQANAYKQFIVSLKEGGDVKFELFFDPNDTTQNFTAPVPGTSPGGVQGIFESRLVVDWQLVLPVSPAAMWTFSGAVTAFDNKYDVTGAIMASCTIKVSGKPTLT